MVNARSVIFCRLLCGSHGFWARLQQLGALPIYWDEAFHIYYARAPYLYHQFFTDFPYARWLNVMLIAALVILFPVWVNVSLGLVAIAIGLYLNTLSVPYPWLIWLGITEQGRGMVDYYPLLPWGGFALLGVALGMVVYRSGALVGTTALTTLPPVRALRFLGRHSLPISFCWGCLNTPTSLSRRSTT